MICNSAMFRYYSQLLLLNKITTKCHCKVTVVKKWTCAAISPKFLDSLWVITVSNNFSLFFFFLHQHWELCRGMLAQLSFSVMTCYGRQEAHTHILSSLPTTAPGLQFYFPSGSNHTHNKLRKFPEPFKGKNQVAFTSPTKSPVQSLSSFHLEFPSSSTASGSGEHILS